MIRNHNSTLIQQLSNTNSQLYIDNNQATVRNLNHQLLSYDLEQEIEKQKYATPLEKNMISDPNCILNYQQLTEYFNQFISEYNAKYQVFDKHHKLLTCHFTYHCLHNIHLLSVKANHENGKIEYKCDFPILITIYIFVNNIINNLMFILSFCYYFFQIRLCFI